jgi:hypothetical protein
VSSWVGMIIDHACHATDDNDVFAERTLIGLLSANPRLLVQVISEDAMYLFESLLLTKVRRCRRCTPLAHVVVCSFSLTRPRLHFSCCQLVTYTRFQRICL